MLGPGENKTKLVWSSLLKLVSYVPEHEALGFHATSHGRGLVAVKGPVTVGAQPGLTKLLLLVVCSEVPTRPCAAGSSPRRSPMETQRKGTLVACVLSRQPPLTKPAPMMEVGRSPSLLQTTATSGAAREKRQSSCAPK